MIKYKSNIFEGNDIYNMATNHLFSVMADKNKILFPKAKFEKAEFESLKFSFVEYDYHFWEVKVPYGWGVFAKDDTRTLIKDDKGRVRGAIFYDYSNTPDVILYSRYYLEESCVSANEKSVSLRDRLDEKYNQIVCRCTMYVSDFSGTCLRCATERMSVHYPDWDSKFDWDKTIDLSSSI